jgi:lipopolysaccharide biosynthesis protein
MGGAEKREYDVFHGTMFWVRPLALTPLRGLRLANAFAPEAGLSDGALEHAVEGLFNHSVRLAGFQVAGVSAG